MVFYFVIIANLVVLFCLFNPWFEEWQSHGVLFLVVEAALLVLIGIPVVIHHLHKGLSFQDALAAAFRSVLDFMAGWV